MKEGYPGTSVFRAKFTLSLNFPAWTAGMSSLIWTKSSGVEPSPDHESDQTAALRSSKKKPRSSFFGKERLPMNFWSKCWKWQTIKHLKMTKRSEKVETDLSQVKKKKKKEEGG